jgi:CheY-like chemotaxis protein
MKTVMVVEDDEDVRDTLAMALGEEGYEVETACHGRVALDKLAMMPEGAPCLVLLDLMMPVMTGQELLAELHARGKATTYPVVVLSAQSENAAGLGARRLMKKPIKLAHLLEVVKDVCGNP